MELKPANDKPIWNGHRQAGKPQDRRGKTFNTSVIVHTSENSLSYTARQLMDWQNRQTENNGKKYSGYHFPVDKHDFYEFADPLTTRMYHGGKSIVQPGRTAGASNDIGMSMVAFCKKWKSADQAKVAELMEQASRCAAYLHLTYNIPLVHISRANYKAGQHGFIGHQEVATPRGRKSDPGMRRGFNWDKFLDRAKVLAGEAPAKTPQGKPVPYPYTAAWMDEFHKVNKAKDISPKSLAYDTEVIRSLRKELGLPVKSTPAQVVKALLERK